MPKFIYEGSNLTSKEIFKDNKEESLEIEVKENHTLNVLYFSRINDHTDINIKVYPNSNLHFDFVLLNQQSNIKLTISILGEGADVTVSSLTLAKEGKKNLEVNIIHEAPNSTSQVINNGISFYEGHNNFNINGTIKKQMSGSNARQLTKGIILDETGSCKALPILYIDNYDVKAYHGASIGRINSEDLFYLMSRGLSKREAFMLIINGLMEPFVKKIDDQSLQDEITKQYLTFFEE